MFHVKHPNFQEIIGVYMPKNRFTFIANFIVILTILYLILFMNYHIYTSDIGELDINITQDENFPETASITISPNKKLKNYYVLIYEDDDSNNWLYFSNNATGKDTHYILDELLPPHKIKYALLEGSSTKNMHTFNIKSKYPISHLANKDHVFHAYLIVPYSIFPFPKFYYIKHQIFFINIGI